MQEKRDADVSRLASVAGQDVADAVARGLRRGRNAFDRFRNDVHFKNATMWMVEILKTNRLDVSDLRECCDMAEAIYDDYQEDQHGSEKTQGLERL